MQGACYPYVCVCAVRSILILSRFAVVRKELVESWNAVCLSCIDSTVQGIADVSARTVSPYTCACEMRPSIFMQESFQSFADGERYNTRLFNFLQPMAGARPSVVSATRAIFNKIF